MFCSRNVTDTAAAIPPSENKGPPRTPEMSRTSTNDRTPESRATGDDAPRLSKQSYYGNTGNACLQSRAQLRECWECMPPKSGSADMEHSKGLSSKATTDYLSLKAKTLRLTYVYPTLLCPAATHDRLAEAVAHARLALLNATKQKRCHARLLGTLLFFCRRRTGQATCWGHSLPRSARYALHIVFRCQPPSFVTQWS